MTWHYYLLSPPVWWPLIALAQILYRKLKG